MEVLYRIFRLLFSLLLTLSFCNGRNVTVQIVGSIDCTDCIKQEFNSSQQPYLGLNVDIECKGKNGEVTTRGNGTVDQEGKFNIPLSDQITEDEATEEECFAKLHNASGATCPIQSAQTASMNVIRSNDNGTQTELVTEKLNFSPGTCQSAFFWPFIRFKNFTHVPPIITFPFLSPPPAGPVVYTPIPKQAPPPLPPPVPVDPSLPPTKSPPNPTPYLKTSPPPVSVDPPLPPAKSPASQIHYSTSPPAPVCKDPPSPPIGSPPERLNPPPPVPVYQSPSPPSYSSLAPPTPTYKNPLSPPPKKLPSPKLAKPYHPPSPKHHSPTLPPMPAYKRSSPPPASPLRKSAPPSYKPLPPVPTSPPTYKHPIIVPRAPPVPKLPSIPKVPRRYFNSPKSGFHPPNPTHHLP